MSENSSTRVYRVGDVLTWGEGHPKSYRMPQAWWISAGDQLLIKWALSLFGYRPITQFRVKAVLGGAAGGILQVERTA